DPSDPFVVGEVATTGPAWGIVARPPWVFVATDRGVSVLDVQDPAAPLEAATVETAGRARALALEGDLLAVADGEGGLALIDVADPERPEFLSSVATSNSSTSNASAVALRGGRAWTAEGQGRRLGGLRALRVEDPALATLVGASSNAFGLNAIAIDGPIALTSDFFFVNAVPIFDISGPNPIFRTALNFAGDPNGHDLAIAEGVVYSAAGPGLDRTPGCQRGGVLQIGRYAELVGEAPPVVEILDPSDGDTALERHPLRVTVDAEDDVLVTEVELWADGALVGIDTAAPYEIDVVPAAGATQLELQAFARDGEAGNRSASEVVTLTVAPDDRPVVRIVAPPQGASLVEAAFLDVVVEASDDVALDLVELLVDGVVHGDSEGSPAVFSVLAEIGATEIEVQARAEDSLGQTATSELLRLAVLPDPPPEVAILEPAAPREVSANTLVQVEVGAADNRAVERVELRVDGASAGELSTPPYTWIVAVPIGPASMTLEAEAWDDLDRSSVVALTLDILPGATTRVEGIVIDPSGSPLSGVVVDCAGAERTTNAAGTFFINDFPVSGIGIQCDALLAGAPDLIGLSELVPPVFSGTTDLGAIVLGAPLAFLGTGSTFGFDFSPHLYASDEALVGLVEWDPEQEDQPSGLAFSRTGTLWQARTDTIDARPPSAARDRALGPGRDERGDGAGDSWSFLLELDPGTAQLLREPVFVDTPPPGAAIIDLAVDPGTGQLYGVDHVFLTGGSRLLSIDPSSGTATLVGNLPVYRSAGLDFDNQRRLWVLSEDGGNWRLHQVDPASGTVLATANLSRTGTIAGMSRHVPSDQFLVASGDFVYAVLPGSSIVSQWSALTGQSSSGELAGIAIRRTGGGAAVPTTFGGRVVDDFGSPVAGAAVMLPGTSTTTAADGTFSLTAVPRTTKVRLVVQTSSSLAYSDALVPPAGGSVDAGDIVVSGFGGEG
ncbi:MAG: Ig-like domain-containing protein, partial [Holophagales bacterium]|nr:Ig-like domain-containing protein [Holophagales bacterium]